MVILWKLHYVYVLSRVQFGFTYKDTTPIIFIKQQHRCMSKTILRYETYLEIETYCVCHWYDIKQDTTFVNKVDHVECTPNTIFQNFM